MDPLTDARDLVLSRFPDATWAVLTGSVLGPARTPGSDLDIMVLRKEPPHFRESLYFRGWPVELFVNTPASLQTFLAGELAARKPSTHRMLAQGVPLFGDPTDLTQACARTLAAGPPTLTAAETDRLRYALTDLLDDLHHATDPGERTVTAATLWTETARFHLATNGRWLSNGKWLLRELREHDPTFATRWLQAQHDPSTLATEVLTQAGGPLFDGYHT
jgi:hypothetical protein